VLTLCTAAPVTAASPPDYTKDPVLMVHGYFLDGVASWTWMKAGLVDAGWPEEYVQSFTFDSVVGCNPGHAQELKAQADALMQKTGRDRFDIVCHSMGCLDSRYYIKYLCGYQHVKDFVSIAGANKGSVVACADPISCGAAQMCVGPADEAWMQNPFLLDLNFCDMTPGQDTLYTAIWTPLDEIVVPQENATLDGAVNIEVQSLVGHGLILSKPETLSYVIPALDGAGSNDNAPLAAPPCVSLCEAPVADPIEPAPDADMADAVAWPVEPAPDAAGSDVVSDDLLFTEGSSAPEVFSDTAAQDSSLDRGLSPDADYSASDSPADEAIESSEHGSSDAPAASVSDPALHVISGSRGAGCGAGRAPCAGWHTWIVLALLGLGRLRRRADVPTPR